MFQLIILPPLIKYKRVINLEKQIITSRIKSEDGWPPCCESGSCRMGKSLSSV